MRFIPYVRVSTDEQFERGNSIPDQKEKVLQYIKAAAAEAACDPIVDDKSGLTLDRPGLNRARRMLTSGEADGIVCFRSDRLTRSLAHSVMLRDEFARLGVEVHFTNRGKSENTPDGRLIDNIEATFNAFWRDQIVERTTMGRRRAVMDRGKFVGAQIPYGYVVDADRHLLIDESHAKTVKQIYVWYDEGKAIWWIAAELNRQGVPSPTGVKWGISSVAFILHNETYAGVWWYGKHRRETGKNHKIEKPKSEWVSADVPAIISRSMWERAQRRFAANKKAAARNQKYSYLLKGMVFCGNCNKPMRCWAEIRYGNVSRRYSCSEKGGYRKCSVYVRASEFEESFWKEIENLLSEPERLEEGLEKARRVLEQSLEDKTARIFDIERLIKEAIDEADALAKALGKSKGVVGEAIQSRMNEVNARYDALTREKQELVNNLKVEIDQDRIDLLEKLQRKFYKGLANLTEEEKRSILQLMSTQIVIFEDRAVVNLNISPEFQIVFGTSRSAAESGTRHPGGTPACP